MIVLYETGHWYFVIVFVRQRATLTYLEALPNISQSYLRFVDMVTHTVGIIQSLSLTFGFSVIEMDVICRGSCLYQEVIILGQVLYGCLCYMQLVLSVRSLSIKQRRWGHESFAWLQNYSVFWLSCEDWWKSHFAVNSVGILYGTSDADVSLHCGCKWSKTFHEPCQCWKKNQNTH